MKYKNKFILLNTYLNIRFLETKKTPQLGRFFINEIPFFSPILLPKYMQAKSTNKKHYYYSCIFFASMLNVA
ncbi:MAG: hypothetical protein ACI902_002347 [Psychroserpens sp.]|jgi:hypothetical protein